MPSSGEGVSIEVLREAVRMRIADSSLRATAREIGVSHPALLDFMNGSHPYAATLGKMHEWYARETNEMLRLRQENAALKKEVAELKKEIARLTGKRRTT